MSKRKFQVPCRVDVQNTWESLHAHVELPPDVEIGPGDKVRVHGDPIFAPLGESLVLEREATVIRANWLQRMWTKFTAHFEVDELYEVSFTPTPRRAL